MICQKQVVVIGGGPAGICAALATARQGAETVLVTNRPMPGGNSSSEIRVWTRGATGGGNLYAEEMGIWGELKLRNLYLNPEANPVFWDDVLLEQLLEQERLELYFNTEIDEIQQVDTGRILSVTGRQQGTEKTIAFFGDFFIDATGDGTLGCLAGVPWTMGKESRDAYGESFAPEREEPSTFGNTAFFFTRRTDKPVRYEAPSFAYPMERIEGMLDKGGRIVNEQMNGCDYWWFEMGGMDNTISDAQEIALELRRLMTGVWNYVKNSGRYDADHLTLDWAGSLPGKRESRRMQTEHVLRQQEVLGLERREDSAFYGGWYLDFHPSDGVNTGEENCVQIPVQVYPLPLACLYHRKAPNLLFAGRDIGVSHVAFASTRIMNTCALSGQAAGTLAVRCIEDGCVPADLSLEQIRRIQQQLMLDDMLIPGISFDQTEDLAAQAAVTVSSAASCGGDMAGTPEAGAYPLEPDPLEPDPSEPNPPGAYPPETYPLEAGSFLIAPLEAEDAAFLVRADRPGRIAYRLYGSSLPSRIACGKELGRGVLEVEAGEQWIHFPAPAEAGFLKIVVDEAEGVEAVASGVEYPGFLMGHQDRPEYHFPKIRTAAALYGGENLTNGADRLWDRPNLWISEKEDRPWAELAWEQAVKIGQVDIYFNPDLNRELVSSRAETWDAHHKYVARHGMPPQLVRNAVLWGRGGDGTWWKLAGLNDNWRRRWEVRFPEPLELHALKLEITGTYGGGRWSWGGRRD